MPEYDIRNYTEGDWLERLAYTDEWNVRALFALLTLIHSPDQIGSFVDVGCGRGILVDLMDGIVQGASLGVDLFTPKEICPWLRGDFVVHDLREPLPDALESEDRRYILNQGIASAASLCISWEVGEHLPSESADNYCDILATFTGKWLVFTAAGPNQGGDHHINQQPQEYWRDKLEARGLEYRPHLTGHLRALWGTVNISDGSDFVAVTGPCSWLPHNVQVFRRKE